MDVPAFLLKLHPVLIHFPIAGYLLAALFSYLAVFSELSNKLDEELLMKISLVNFWIGTISYPVVALTGMIDAVSFPHAISVDLLALKIIAGICTVVMLISMFLILGTDLFHGDILVQKKSQLLSYFVLINIIAVLITLTATWGGIYVFNHSLFDIFGLRDMGILPTSVNQPVSNLFPTVFEAIFYSPFTTAGLVIIFIVIILLIRKLRPTTIINDFSI